MMRTSRRRRDAALLLPAAVGSAGLGAAGALNPIAGIGLGGFTIISILPWVALYVTFVFAALGNRWGTTVGGITVRLAQVVLIPFAVRAYTVTKESERPRWRLAEWFLICFVALQFVTSYFNAAVKRQSLANAGIVALGAITYLAVYTAVTNERRLRLTTKIFLVISVAGAVIGILSLAAYFGGYAGGIQLRQVKVFGGAPPVRGLAYEHDLFGSTCACAAIILMVLRRQGEYLFKPSWMRFGFWACVVGMIVSQGRAAYVAFAVCVLLMYLVPMPRRPGHRVSRLGISLLLIAVVIGGLFWAAAGGVTTTDTTGQPVSSISTAITSKIANSLNLSSGTGAHRVYKYSDAWNELLMEPFPLPFVGNGTNSWGETHFHPGPAHSYVPAYIESLYVRALWDSGFLGILLIAVFIGALLWPTREVLYARTPSAPLARALVFGALLVAITYAVTDSTLLIWPWILFGLTRAARTLTTGEARERPARIRPAPNGHLERAPVLAG